MPSQASRLPDAPMLALLGVCIYLVGFAFPIPWQLPLLLFVALAVLAVLSEGATKRRPAPRILTIAVAIFLLATVASVLGSRDPSRSLALSAAWVPGALLFVVIGERIRLLDHVRILFVAMVAVALLLSIWLLVATGVYGTNPHEWLQGQGIPVLVVPNDCNFLALLTPLALVLVLEKPRSPQAILGILAIVAVALVIAVFTSRGAALTMGVSLVAAAGLARPRLAWAVVAVLLVGFLVVDGVMGFALTSKFTRVVDSRISLWLMAWEMFLHAPWLGQGPATFRVLYPLYLEIVPFPDWVVMDPWGGPVPWAHNLYLELLAERGVVGFVAFSGMIAAGLTVSGRLLRRHGAGPISWWAAGATASLLGFLFSGLYETSLVRIWAVVLLLSLLGILASLSVLGGTVATKRTGGGGEKAS